MELDRNNEINNIVYSYRENRKEEDFEKLIKRLEPLVHHLAFKYNIKNYSHEDLLQEGYLVVYELVKNYDFDKDVKFSTFVYISVENRYKNLLRRELSEKRKSNQNNVYLYDKINSEESSELLELCENKKAVNPYCELLKKELYSYFEMYKHQLSLVEKQVLELKVIGLKLSEISRTLNLDYKVCDNALNRARNKYIKYFDGYI